MRVLKWTPFFDIKEKSSIVPIWISFPNLRLHFFHPKVLHALGTIFGRPLQTDQATASRTRPSVARVLVEVDISKKHPKEVWVGSKAFGYLQKAEFEKIPDFCTHCKVHGHANVDCFKLHPEFKKTANYVSVRHGSAVNNPIEVANVEDIDDNQDTPVEPPHTEHNNQFVEGEEKGDEVPEEIGNTDLMVALHSNEGNQSNEASKEPEIISSTPKSPKLVILVVDLLNEMPIISNSVAIENDLLSKQGNKDEVINSRGAHADLVEDGEFIPPTNVKASLNLVPPKLINNGEEEWLQKGGKKKGKNGKNTTPATPRSTRAQTSAKNGND
ncbi:hypothetical protein MA16_Dca019577 [Dendrobium catenatum]|uniref:Uncharacterized protein n=1 Tax=Dendrobium catenatum TaxID=906689 RepID=A0A2I0X327_9ASPA|nr:hypothetical protein MA16_Dca019577 [Dendrobium catenatum]